MNTHTLKSQARTLLMVVTIAMDAVTEAASTR